MEILATLIPSSFKYSVRFFGHAFGQCCYQYAVMFGNSFLYALNKIINLIFNGFNFYGRVN